MNDRHNLTLDAALRGLGERGTARALQLFPCDGSVWYIEAGHVDVFLVPAGADGGTGARTHLYSVHRGGVLAFPPQVALGCETLAIVPGPDAEYRVIARADVLAMLDTPPWRDQAIGLLDRMAAAIGSGCQIAAMPKCLPLEAGPRAASADQTLILTPSAAGLWLEGTAGQVTVCGEHVLAQPLPLPVAAWATLPPGSAVCAVPLPEMAARHGMAAMLAGIDTLHGIVLRQAVQLKQKYEADELNRLQKKHEIGRQAMADALSSFVSLFHAAEQEGAPATGGNFIMNACQHIGAHAGITFKAPPPPASGVRRRDPVKEIAQASAVRTRLVALKGEWWSIDNGPLLVFPEKGGNAFALLPLRSGGYQGIDGTTGARFPVTAEFAEGLRSFAYTFYASLPPQKLALRDILRFVANGIWRDIAAVAAIGLASALLAMAIPLASGHLFDNVFPAADRGQMVQVVLVLFIASLVTLLFEATRALAMLRIEGKAGSDLQAAVWDRVLNLPVPFFRDYSAGDLATRINGINEIRQALSGTVISTIITSLFSVLNVALLFYYSSSLALAAVLLVAVAIAANLAIGFFSVRIRRETADINGKVTGKVLEFLNGIAKLRMTGAESRAFANWAAGFAAQKRLARRAGALANISTTVNAAYPVLANAAIFASIGMVLAEQDTARFTTGDFIAFSAAWTVFLNSTLSLVRTGLDLLSITSTYERTLPILESPPEIDDNKAYPGVLQGAIELSNLRFSYSQDGPVILDDVSMSIKPGEFVALVGGSGSGKSTLLRLMLGFEQATHGGVYYDGHNLNEVDVGAVRRQLGVVLQSGKVMSGDIYTNIIGANALTLDDAWEAARACGLDKDIEALPMGMHTLLSDGAGTLSGGQRQRLLIARAIVNKPRIIFFDEATSALDNQSQATVSASMEQLRATRVVIAHRLSTIINADRIYVLDKGRVVQSGTYDELMQQDGLFAELAKRQIA